MQNQALEELKNKFVQYVGHVEQLRQAKQNSEQVVAALQQQLLQKDAEIDKLQTSLKNRNIAEAVAGSDTSDTKAAKAKIAELMREIDKCIALLNV